MSKLYRCRTLKYWYGVSEYVATLTIAIITLAAGVGIFAYSYYIIDSYYSRLVAVAEGTRGRGGDIAILASLIDSSGKIVVIGSTGSKPVMLYAIHINNTLYTQCTVHIDGYNNTYTLDGSSYIQIPYYITFKSICITPSTTSQAIIKIVYEGGEKTVYVTKI
ncbi:MAG: hypothetical protein QW311_03250 [Ignisphaera sp.]